MFPSSFPSIFQITFTFTNTCTHFISFSSITKVRIYIYEILVWTMYQLVMFFFLFLRFYIFDSMPQCFLILLVKTDVTFSLGKGQKLDYGHRNLNLIFYYVSVI